MPNAADEAKKRMSETHKEIKQQQEQQHSEARQQKANEDAAKGK